MTRKTYDLAPPYGWRKIYVVPDDVFDDLHWALGHPVKPRPSIKSAAELLRRLYGLPVEKTVTK